MEDNYNKKLEYNARYNKEHYKAYTFRLSYDTEDEIIQHLWLYRDDFKNYIKSLVLKDIRRIEAHEKKLEKVTNSKKDISNVNTRNKKSRNSHSDRSKAEKGAKKANR